MNKTETLEFLEEQGIRFERTEHPAAFTMEDLEAANLPWPDRMGKNLFVRDNKKRNYYLITVKGEKRVDIKAFWRKYDLHHLSFASAEDLNEILKLTPGSVTPLGLLSDEERKVTFYLDREFSDGIIGVHPCENTATVWLQTEELLRLIRDHGNDIHIVDFDN